MKKSIVFCFIIIVLLSLVFPISIGLAADQIKMPTIISPTSYDYQSITVSGDLTVSWESTGVYGTTYSYKAIINGTTTAVVPQSNTTGTSFTIPFSSLENGTTYKVWVRATASGYIENNCYRYFTVYKQQQIKMPTITSPASTNYQTVNASGDLTVSWESTGVYGTTYSYKAIIDGTSTIIVPQNTTTGTSFTIPYSSLENGKTYKVWVRATADGYIENNCYRYFYVSKQSQIKYPNVISPTSVNYQSVTATGDLTVSWESTGVSGTTYSYKAIVDGTSTVVVPQNSTTGTSFTIPYSSLENGTTYKVWVRATASGYIENNCYRYFTVYKQHQIKMPTITSPTSTNYQTVTASGDLTVSWESTGISGTTYSYKAIVDGTSTIVVPQTNTTGTSFTIPFSSLESGKTYKVWVRATADGYIENNCYRYFTVTKQYQIKNPNITSPTSTNYQTVTATGDLTVSWQSTGISGTTYSYKAIIDGTSTVIVPEANTTGTSFKIPFSSLENGKTYKVWVRATASGYIENNCYRYFTVAKQSQIKMPNITSPTSTNYATINANGDLTVSWDSTGVSGTTYSYKAIIDGTSTIIVPEASTTTATSFTIPYAKLENGKTYKVWVRATASGYIENNCYRYFTVTKQIKMPNITSPTSTNYATINANGDLTVSWDSTGVSGTTYSYKAIIDGTSTIIVPEASTTTATSFTIAYDKLENGKTYKVWVRATASGYLENNCYRYFTVNKQQTMKAPNITSPASTDNETVPAIEDITVSWEGTGVEGTTYTYSVTLNGTSTKIVPENSTKGTSFIIPADSLESGSKYMITVKASAPGYIESTCNRYFTIAALQQLKMPTITSPSSTDNETVSANGDIIVGWEGTGVVGTTYTYSVVIAGTPTIVVPQNNTSETSFKIPADSLETGSKYMITVKASAPGYTENTCTRYFTIAAQQQLKIPTITSPSSIDNETIPASGDITVSWDSTGVEGTVYTYNVLVDGTTTIVVPDSKTPNTSFTIPVDVLEVGNKYMIFIKAAANGYIESSCKRSFIIASPQQLKIPTITSPTSKDYEKVLTTGDLTVSWEGSGVEGTTYSYNVLIDGTTTIIVPDSNTTKTSFTIPVDSLEVGNTYIIWVRASAKGYTDNKCIRYFTTATPTINPSIGYLDNPVEGKSISGKFNVSGWYLDMSGVSSIEVIVDGQVIGTAIYGDARSDVNTAYPNYGNKNSGFHYVLDTSSLNNGTHTINIRETNKIGVQNMMFKNGRSFTVSNALPTLGSLDNPSTGKTVSGKFNVYGWYLDTYGVTSIEVIVDGQVKGTAIYGDPRSDVNTAYPKYSNKNSGFHFELDTTILSNGTHTINIRETNKNGVPNMLFKDARSFTVSNMPTIGSLDNPSSGKTVSGKFNVYGWYLDISGVSSIEVIVDGQVKGTAIYGDPRSDVNTAYPKYGNTNSGYHFELDTSSLSNGIHTINIRGTSKSGIKNMLFKDSRSFMVNNILQ